MPTAIEQIVHTYVQLKDRRALLQLRAHRQRLVVDINKLRARSNYDFGLALGSIREDLTAIDAGVQLLDESCLSVLEAGFNMRPEPVPAIG